MRAVAQRVARASVEVGGEVVGAIDRGLLVYVGVASEDDEREASWLADKVRYLRVFEDEQGKMARDVGDVGGAVLVISQFTLIGDVKRGRRPSFSGAMAPEPAARLYEFFVDKCRSLGVPVETGRFRADMKVSSLNDGPITIVIDSPREGAVRNPGAPHAVPNEAQSSGAGRE